MVGHGGGLIRWVCFARLSNSTDNVRCFKLLVSGGPVVDTCGITSGGRRGKSGYPAEVG